MDHVIVGFGLALTLQNLAVIVAGTVLGVFVGAMPGLSSTIGLAIAVPFTFVLQPIPAILMMVALYMAAEYGGSITAIAVGIPGTPPAMTTTFDGYPMTKKGQTGKALGVSLVSSVAGGVFGTLILVIAFGPIASFSLTFGPVEYFALGVFGLSLVGNLVGESLVKGFISVIVGLLVFVVGLDVLSGYPRLTFGSTALLDGVNLIPAMIGLFAISEVFKLVEASGGVAKKIASRVSDSYPTWREIKGLVPTILRSSMIGTTVGAVPGAGAIVASLISWNAAKRMSSSPEKFGTGIIEGVSASEAANNASVGGAMIPLLTLGVPGSGSTAVMLGGLMVHGVNPGPLLLVENPELVYAVYAGLLLSAGAMLVIGLLGIPIWVRIIAMPTQWLAPMILGISLVGAYSLGNSMSDVGMATFFGVLGYLMLRFGFPLVPTVLALVLGFMVETNYRRALSLSGGDHMTFATSPISVTLLSLAVLSFAIPVVKNHIVRSAIRGPETGPAESGDADRRGADSA